MTTADKPKRKSRAAYPWMEWILRGTPEKPIRLVIGKHLPTGYKMASLVAQLHNYTNLHNHPLPTAQQIKLGTSRAGELELLVYNTTKASNGHVRLRQGHPIGNPYQPIKARDGKLKI